MSKRTLTISVSVILLVLAGVLVFMQLKPREPETDRAETTSDDTQSTPGRGTMAVPEDE